jgi:predicted transcriptional regulator
MIQCPHCKQFILPKRQTEVRAWVKDKSAGVVSPDLAKAFKISTASASNALKLLSDLGSIWREEETDPTGGKIFRYWRTKPERKG